ncbi:hypothetical protein GCM10010319_50400 [Streptomyces blastmyceticus]|uniref:Uncharacterized protein n=1 Tax=Streptomyces blastmyceticus TaxID=68180 RepID=A0ABN0XKE4_9ACTN
MRAGDDSGPLQRGAGGEDVVVDLRVAAADDFAPPVAPQFPPGIFGEAIDHRMEFGIRISPAHSGRLSLPARNAHERSPR